MHFGSSFITILWAGKAYASPAKVQARFGNRIESVNTENSRLADRDAEITTPPELEPITVTELPLPPATSDTAVGGCTEKINPRRTGRIGTTPVLQSGDFLPDDLHVVAAVKFTGAPTAPTAPDAGSIDTGLQSIIVKVDNTTFPNGDAWNVSLAGFPRKTQPFAAKHSTTLRSSKMASAYSRVPTLSSANP